MKETPDWRLVRRQYGSLLLRVYYFEELKAAKPTVFTECEKLVADACKPILDELVEDAQT